MIYYDIYLIFIYFYTYMYICINNILNLTIEIEN